MYVFCLNIPLPSNDAIFLYEEQARSQDFENLKLKTFFCSLAMFNIHLKSFAVSNMTVAVLVL